MAVKRTNKRAADTYLPPQNDKNVEGRGAARNANETRKAQAYISTEED